MIDEDSFNALYRETHAPLRAYAVRVLGNVTQADDIVQETYLRLLRASVSVDEAAALRAYVFRIASNLMTDYFRGRWRERPLDERPEHAMPDRDLPLGLDMARMLGRLRVRDRQLLWLAHVEGASARELATILGLREGSVRVLLLRARRRLAALIEGHER